ncbi:Spermidine synthase [Nocardioides exalbidus]|uniref:Spermidine synthase n=1 Tax=Nocardioides exalbidus TaxID=402596 RepID=A0A1H4NDZ9_9ACTN|nr:fused MFS/spermidine synthase [Nocardioides exalbidus]SEB93540.1 Spermidine synthase [Nocardioides exalbidus]
MNEERQETAYGIGAWAAAALVFGSSAAVLVVELVALRLLAPHYGLTLETNTMVIGLALTAIAAGTWAGGSAADRLPPRHLLGPLLGISGAAVAVTPSVVRASAASDNPGLLLIAATLSILVPGALLSAVSPVVIKLRLRSLDETGSVVGHLSGIGTVGAIFGTVVTGFVLISRVPVSGILVGLGVALLVTSVLVQVAGRRGRGDLVTAAVVALGALGAAAAPSGCDTETTYHCLAVDADPLRASGQVLVLDGLRHSYVDDDPTFLEFSYVQAMASVVDTAFPEGDPLDAYYLGAGGLTLPRYVAATRPGSANLVSEIDGGVVEVDRELLGDDFPASTDVRIEDGRLALDDLEPASRDLVVGDAFGGISVPWHLATEEVLAGIERALGADGVYVANVIDNAPLAFARAYVRTTAEVFDEVALLAAPEVLAGTGGGNLVVVASQQPVDLAAVEARAAERDLDWGSLAGDDLAAWFGDAPLLTDDFAPVDQLLTPYRQ